MVEAQSSDLPPSRLIETLISALQSSKVLKPIFESLYCFLVHWSLDHESRWIVDEGANSDQFELTFKDICNLSTVLFDELSRRLPLTLHDVPMSGDVGQAHSNFDVCLDELLAQKAMGNCMVLSDFVSPLRQNMPMHLAIETGGLLDLISAHFLLSVSGFQAFEEFIKNLTWPHKPSHLTPELSLSVAVSLLINPVMISAPAFLHAHVMSLVSEVIGTSIMHTAIKLEYTHFYLSAFERSVILYSSHVSHIQIYNFSKDSKGSSAKSFMLERSGHPSFEAHMHPVMNNRVTLVLMELDNLWNSHACKMFIKTKSDMVTASIAYMEENLYLLDESLREKAVSFLSSVIMRAFSAEAGDVASWRNGSISLQDISLLASILKLMSCSMLQAIWCISGIRNLNCTETSRETSFQKEYDFLIGLINSFGSYKIWLPIQELLIEALDNDMSRHKGSKLMLVHFTGLLSLCSVSGFDFLAKCCLSVMMVLMNVLIFEDGGLDFLDQVLSSQLESHSSGLSSGRFTRLATNCAAVEYIGRNKEGDGHRRSSQIVASKLRKTQMLYLRGSFSCNSTGVQSKGAETSENVLPLIDGNSHVVGVEEESQETCTGEVFLRCILEGSEKSSDTDDLTDFIECKQGKDYSAWLRDKEKYRKWKQEKMAILRWRRKKTVWKSTRRKM
ncbi:hypothetical protein Ancab_012553 [Ancistrocladus abbreviatus]